MINYTHLTKVNISPRKKYRRWINELVVNYNFQCGNLHYIFCSDEYLLELNKKFLEHDWYTDIITFDYSEGRIISGEIFISVDRVTENAKKFGSTFHDELLRVMAHGILHLCGWQDETQKEKEKMRQEEEIAMSIFYNLKNDN